MAKTNTSAVEVAQTRWAPLFGSAVPDVDQVVQASNTLLSAWMSAGDEILAFSKTRLDQSIAMSRQMVQAASLTEAMELQTQFNRTLMQDYLQGMKKLADLGTHGVMESISALQQEPSSSTASSSKA